MLESVSMLRGSSLKVEEYQSQEEINQHLYIDCSPQHVYCAVPEHTYLNSYLICGLQHAISWNYGSDVPKGCTFYVRKLVMAFWVSSPPVRLFCIPYQRATSFAVWSMPHHESKAIKKVYQFSS